MASLSPWQFTNLRAVNCRKMFKNSRHVPFDTDLSILFCAKTALELVRLVQLPSMLISDPVSLDRGWELLLLVLFPGTMNFCCFPPPNKVNLQADQEVKFELKNSSLETLSQDIPRYPWLLNILIHYMFLSKLNRFVFHLQSACELSVCFQRGHCFNWMNGWHLILMPCAKH